MLKLATSKPAKYLPFAADLERWRIALAAPPRPLLEIQCQSFNEALEAKAKAAADMFGCPVLVDDAGLALEAYPEFPGALTSLVVPKLGVAGLQRLLKGVSHRATMECHLGCWTGYRLRSWSGRVHGVVDFSRGPRDPRMILSDLFVPDEAEGRGELLHRSKALAALEKDIFELHLECGSAPACPIAGTRAGYDCAFCTEFDEPDLSIFRRMAGGRISSRVVYQDEDFVVMPPIGQFIEGGLLLLTRGHIPSFAHLPPEQFVRLEQLLGVIRSVLTARWGVSPLVFEHGPALDKGKGVCCVDHAHFNIFPASVVIHPHLEGRMHIPLSSVGELPKLRSAEFGYLFVQENDGVCRAYDAQSVTSQLVRRIITHALGMPERWHWRDYPGLQELAATLQALQGKVRL